jgi:hypothetical protein
MAFSRFFPSDILRVDDCSMQEEFWAYMLK